MLVRSDRNIHYPITVTSLSHKVADKIEKHQPLFSYTYKTKVDEYDQYGEARQVDRSYPANYNAPTEGTITAWKIRRGAVIEKPGTPLVEIEEACAHDVQFGGLCVNCGRDMGVIDYGTTSPDFMRAGVSVAHSSAALKVSENEARRLDKDLKTRLLDSRKLLLVVDLDQTIIHATVDPTVDEWQNDSSNPNYDAVKDVEKFQLKEETPGYDCWYYVKMRPQLKDFLREMSELFEMHIYTMGTRAYAKEIAHIVDESKKVFGDRILAREDNQDMTRKSLANLFPVDTKMAVIIDDRGDVWQWSDHLIKVVPFDFFKGIGDINASFLPKRQDLPPPPQHENETLEKSASADAPAPAAPQMNGSKKRKLSDRQDKAAGQKTDEASNTESPGSVDELFPMASNEASIEEQSSEHDQQLKAQIEDQPLRKMQREIEEEDENLATQTTTQTTTADTEDTQSTEVASDSPRPRHKLLQDDDIELENLRRALKKVHQAFYDRYWKEVDTNIDSARATKLKRRGNTANAQPDASRGRVPEHDLDLVPNMRDIMTEIKSRVLQGCNIVFSGVIPLYSDPKNYENNDLWRWAASFGASVSLDLSKSTTHVVGSKDRYTGKMRTAARNPNIKIVSLDWLSKACRTWKKPDEEDFLIPVEPSRRRTGEEANGKSPASRVLDESDSEEDVDVFEDDDDREDGAHGHHPSIGDMDDDEWSKMHEMFESDEDDDEEEEGENDSETASQTGDSRRKRKREDISDTESVASRGSSANGVLRRKRRVAGRASGLNRVTTLADIEGQDEQPAASHWRNKAEKSPDENPPEEEDDGWENFDDCLEEAIAQEDAEKARKAT